MANASRIGDFALSRARSVAGVASSKVLSLVISTLNDIDLSIVSGPC